MPSPDEALLGGCFAFLGRYVALLGMTLALAFALDAVGVNPVSGLCYSVAILYLWAASRRPRWVFDTVRAIRWFSAITSDRVMRWTLVGIAVVLSAVGTWFQLGRS